MSSMTCDGDGDDDVVKDNRLMMMMMMLILFILGFLNRMVNDATVEKEDAHPGKVCLRSW